MKEKLFLSFLFFAFIRLGCAQLFNFARERLYLLLKLGYFLRYGVGNVNLIEIVDLSSSLTRDTSGDSDRCTVLGDILENYRICRDLTVTVYDDGAQHLCARSDENVIAERGMTLSYVLTRTAERYALVERAIVSYLGCLTDNDARSVVDNESLADGRARVDLNSGKEFCHLAYRPCGKGMSTEIELVRDAVGEDGVQSRIEQKNLYVTFRRGVSLSYCRYIVLYFIFDLIFNVVYRADGGKSRYFLKNSRHVWVEF